jgi:hypothetical protein
MRLQGRFRVVLGLDRKKPVQYLSGCNAVYDGLLANKATFVLTNPLLPALLTQIQNAIAAQQLVTTRVKGAAATRDAVFDILVTSMEMERMMVQGLCDAAPPGQAASIAALASMRGYNLGVFHKDLLSLKNITPSGSVLLDANAGLLDSSSRQKTYNWGYTLDNGKTILPMPSTPVATTTIANLTPLTTVGFQVSVTVHKQLPGAWTPLVYILVR